MRLLRPSPAKAVNPRRLRDVVVKWSVAAALALTGGTACGGTAPQPKPPPANPALTPEDALQIPDGAVGHALHDAYVACPATAAASVKPPPRSPEFLRDAANVDLLPAYLAAGQNYQAAALSQAELDCKMAAATAGLTQATASANADEAPTVATLRATVDRLKTDSATAAQTTAVISAALRALIANPSRLTTTLPFSPSTMLLLHDGRVLAQDYAGRGWWILTPDAKGSYSAGSWSPAAPMSKARLYFTSAVLMDGRVLVGGGEYTGVDHAAQQTEDNSFEIYDPKSNSWSPAPSPPGWAYVGDGPSAVLSDGRLVLGNISDDRTAILDPKTMVWTDGGHKRTPSAEESWVLQTGDSLLTVDCTGARAGRAERWVPGPTGGGSWQDAGQPTQPLVQSGSEEIGPGMRLTDGRTFFVGATGHTELYSPPKTGGTAGTWAKGPDLPLDATGHQQVAKDAPALALPGGSVLLAASSLATPAGYGTQTSFAQFNPVTDSMTPVTLGSNTQSPPYDGRTMLLPNGIAMYANSTPALTFADVADPAALAAGRPAPPVVASAPATVVAGRPFTITGQRFNGASQTVGYGDDASGATNYPLTRLTNLATGTVSYLPTDNPSSLGVDTGDAIVTAQASVPPSTPAGRYSLEVVANGIASLAQPVEVAPSTVSSP